MIFIGMVLGLAFGLISGALFHMVVLNTASLGVLSFLLPILQPIVTILPLLPTLPGFLVIGIDFAMWFVFNFIVFWIFAIFAQASITDPVVTLRTTNTNWQNFYRGFGMGTAATINFAIYFLFTLLALQILAIISILPILAVFSPIRFNRFYQGMIGWIAWVMPISWIVNFFGLIKFLFWAMPSGLSSYGVGAIRIDTTSGVIETRVPMGGTRRAFNNGTFTFLNGNNPAVTQTAFLSPGTSAHEVGHALNNSALTSFWSIGTSLEETRVFGIATFSALGQMAAESRVPRLTPGRFYINLWSA